MSVIEHIVVRCTKQEDYTGSDDLNFYLNDAFVGTTSISSGDTKDLTHSLLTGDLLVDGGTNIKIWEFDALDPSDLLLDHTITADEIHAGSVTLRDQLDGAQYEFTIHFVEF